MNANTILLSIIAMNSSAIAIILGKIAYGRNASGKHKDNKF